MPTPDRSPGVSDEEGIILSDEGVLATQVGEIRYKGTPDNRYSMYDVEAGEYQPIGRKHHKALKDLIHFIADGPADGWASGAESVITTPGPFPDQETWYTDSGHTVKIVDQTVTYNGNKTIATEVWRLYDTDGSTVLVTLTDTHSYSGVNHTGTVRTWA